MKLSEAIRLGAMMGPQAFSGLYEGESSCAMGAAIRASGRHYQDWAQEVNGPYLQCPACEYSTRTTGGIIHLNDRHRWTREQIADWVATIEPAEIQDSRDEREGLEGQGPIGPPPEVETAETKTILI